MDFCQPYEYGFSLDYLLWNGGAWQGIAAWRPFHVKVGNTRFFEEEGPSE
jgi:hypothetical protein